MRRHYLHVTNCRYYCDDPLSKRLFGLKCIPDVATLSRLLKEATAQSVDHCTPPPVRSDFVPVGVTVVPESSSKKYSFSARNDAPTNCGPYGAIPALFATIAILSF